MSANTRPTTLFSFATVKAHLLQDASQNVTSEQAATMAQLADRVSEFIERVTGQVFVTRAVTDDPIFTAGSFFLGQHPVATITSVEVQTGDEWVALDASAWRFDARANMIVLAHPAYYGRWLRASYTAGYDCQDGNTLPADIVGAGLQLLKSQWETHTSGVQSASSFSVGGFNMSFREGMPQMVRQTLESWRRISLG